MNRINFLSPGFLLLSVCILKTSSMSQKWRGNPFQESETKDAKKMESSLFERSKTKSWTKSEID